MLRVLPEAVYLIQTQSAVRNGRIDGVGRIGDHLVTPESWQPDFGGHLRIAGLWP